MGRKRSVPTRLTYLCDCGATHTSLDEVRECQMPGCSEFWCSMCKTRIAIDAKRGEALVTAVDVTMCRKCNLHPRRNKIDDLLSAVLSPDRLITNMKRQATIDAKEANDGEDESSKAGSKDAAKQDPEEHGGD